MSEEKNLEIKDEKCTCFSNSKGFKKFLITALGSFVGVFCALCLFVALHKPHMPMHMPCPCMCPCGCHHMMAPNMGPHNMGRGNMGPKSDFEKRVMPDGARKAPVRIHPDEEAK